MIVVKEITSEIKFKLTKSVRLHLKIVVDGDLLHEIRLLIQSPVDVQHVLWHGLQQMLLNGRKLDEMPMVLVQLP